MARWMLILVLLMSITIPVVAGPDDPLSCTDGTYYLSQFVITPPRISNDLSQLSITVVGSDHYEPVTLIETPDEITICNSNAPQASYYEATLLNHTFAPTQYTSQDTLYLPGQYRLNVGEFDDRFGEALVVLEAYASAGENLTHAYSIELTERMRNNGLPIDVYLFTTAGYAPAMSALAPFQTEATIAEPVEGSQIIAGFGEFDTAIKLSIPSPEFEGAINLNLTTDGVDSYVLVIPIMTGEIIIGEGVAQMRVDETSGQLRVDCAGVEAFDNGVMMTFPETGDFTVTAVAVDPADAVLALIDLDTMDGSCFDNEDNAQLYGVALPSIATTSTGLTAQAPINAGDHLVIGSRGRGRIETALIIEGGTFASGESQVFTITTSTGMVASAESLTVYVISTENSLDPVLTWVDDLGLTQVDEVGDPYICDNAGFGDCRNDSPSLIGAFIRQSDGRLLNGGELDASLQIPITAEMLGTPLQFRVSGVGDSAGRYQLVVHLIVLE